MSYHRLSHTISSKGQETQYVYLNEIDDKTRIQCFTTTLLNITVGNSEMSNFVGQQFHANLEVPIFGPSFHTVPMTVPIVISNDNCPEKVDVNGNRAIADEGEFTFYNKQTKKVDNALSMLVINLFIYLAYKENRQNEKEPTVTCVEDGQKIQEIKTEAILDLRNHKGKVQYLVKWKTIEWPEWKEANECDMELRQKFLDKEGNSAEMISESTSKVKKGVWDDRVRKVITMARDPNTGEEWKRLSSSKFGGERQVSSSGASIL
ncbi:10576_t:CDS:2 [Acaulospora colombiana]|uniref:10576_t:CDS:1 n=1 Tax=Acaulospora colombiana TaxID=27376 RepID=A0ACA9LCU3_9GLOM|nr:10576_t:CDS:2 [Acaulospora colombiana]